MKKVFNQVKCWFSSLWCHFFCNEKTLAVIDECGNEVDMKKYAGNKPVYYYLEDDKYSCPVIRQGTRTQLENVFKKWVIAEGRKEASRKFFLIDEIGDNEAFRIAAACALNKNPEDISADELKALLQI